MLKVELPEVYKNQITYTRDTDNHVMRRVADAETLWLTVTLVQCTLSLHVGNSFTGCNVGPLYPGSRAFDEVWIQGHPTGTAMDSMQQSMRVRYTINNIVRFCMPKEKILVMNAARDPHCFKLLSEFDTFHSSRLNHIRAVCRFSSLKSSVPRLFRGPYLRTS
jgi:hypothetical protein